MAIKSLIIRSALVCFTLTAAGAIFYSQIIASNALPQPIGTLYTSNTTDSAYDSTPNKVQGIMYEQYNTKTSKHEKPFYFYCPPCDKLKNYILKNAHSWEKYVVVRYMWPPNGGGIPTLILNDGTEVSGTDAVAQEIINAMGKQSTLKP